MSKFDMRNRLCLASVFVALLGLNLNPGESLAAFGLSFTGSGTGTSGFPISATAGFDFVQHDFGSGNVDAVKITLINTADSTTLRGNLITGLFFSLDGNVGNLSTTSAGFDGMAGTVRLSNATNTSNVDIAPAVNNTSTDGTYQLSNGPFGVANSGGNYSAFEYGIATVGMGLTGFSGAAVNGDDYGIFASGSPVDTEDGLPQARPLIDTSAMFWIARPALWTSLDQLGTNVRVTYGSLPDSFITITTPEPTSLLVWGGVLGLAVAITRSRFAVA
jgi:hypothetical protein